MAVGNKVRICDLLPQIGHHLTLTLTLTLTLAQAQGGKFVDGRRSGQADAALGLSLIHI